MHRIQHRSALVAICSVVVLSTGASATDLPARAPAYKAPPATVAPSWTGFYVGLGVGFRSSQTEATVTANTVLGVDTLPVICAVSAPVGGCVTGEPLNDTALRLNPYVGFNWQVAPQWVVGVEADGGFGNKTSTLNGMVYPVAGAIGFSLGISGDGADSFSVKTGWDASVRGRVGFLLEPSVLVYATGGAAWLHVEATSTCNTGPSLVCAAGGGYRPFDITTATTKTGWTAGGGIEAMLWANWIVRGEYRYADFGTISNTDDRRNIFGVTVGSSYDLRVRTHTATLGLGYKLGGGGRVTEPGLAAAPAASVFKVSPAAIASSWNGIYAGLGVGARSRLSDAAVTAWTQDAVNTLVGTCTSIGQPGGCIPGEPLNDTGFRFSPYAGINWQVAPLWVAGVEADRGWANKTTTLVGMVYPATGLITGLAADTFSVKTGWDASVRGRLGVLLDPTLLLYATGGAAWLHVESTSTCSTAPILGRCRPGQFSPAVISDSATKLGWTVGGGIETMLWSNWLARAEYRYADFGAISNTDTRTSSAGVVETVSYELRVRTHTATFGLAYKFD